MKILDLYIIRKFLFTFLFITAIFSAIAVVIDLGEKIEDLITSKAPMGAILRYYSVFVPYIAALLAPFFVFIAAIYFTSRMTANSEFVSILGNGISFYRILRPYLVTSMILAIGLYVGNNWVVPEANKVRQRFEQEYIHRKIDHHVDIELVTEKGSDSETNISLRRYSAQHMEGYQFTLNRIEGHKLIYSISAPKIQWLPEDGVWRLPAYSVWTMNQGEEEWQKLQNLDTSFQFTPDDFYFRIEYQESMNTAELKGFIEREKLKGSEKVPFFEVERHRRTSNAFAVIILTFIAVAFSTRKTRGGIGLQLALGLVLSTVFILFLRFSTTFATNANVAPLVAVWIPNLFFSALALIFVRMAPK